MTNTSLHVFRVALTVTLVTSMTLSSIVQAGDNGSVNAPQLPKSQSGPNRMAAAPKSASEAKPDVKPELIESLAALPSVSLVSKLNEDPVIAAALESAKFQLLRTAIDLQDYNTLMQNAFVKAALPDVLAQLDQMVDESVASNNLTMTPLVDGIKSHAQLLALCRRAALESGMTKKQIAEQKYFIAAGPVNAYTQGKLFVVMFNALTDQTSYLEIQDNKPVKHLLKNELLAVLRHETSHQDFKHVVQGTVDMAMAVQLAKIFVGPAAFGGDTETFLNQLSQGTDGLALPLWAKMASDLTNHTEWWSKQAQSSGAAQHHGHAAPNVASLQHLSAAIQRMDALRRQLLAVSEDQVKAQMDNYLVSMINILQRSEVPASTTAFFINMLNTLRTSATLEDARNYSAEKFNEHFGILFAVKQKAREMSADNGTFMGVVPRLGARLFMQFNAAPLDETPLDWPAYTQEIAQTQALYEKIVRDDYERMSTSQMNRIVGGKGVDHPQPAFRAMNLIENSQTVDIVSMRDPFLRLVVIRNFLIKQQATAQAEYAAALKQLEFFKKMMPQMVEPMTAYVNQQKLLAERSGPDADLLTKVIIKKISKLGFDHTNPLFTKLVDYQLARRIQVESGYEEIKAYDQKSAENAKLFLASYDQEGRDLLQILQAEITSQSTSPRAEDRARLVGSLATHNYLYDQLKEIRDRVIHDSFKDGTAPSQLAFDKRKSKTTRFQDEPRFRDRSSSVRDSVVAKLAKPPTNAAVGPGWVQSLNSAMAFNCNQGLDVLAE